MEILFQVQTRHDEEAYWEMTVAHHRLHAKLNIKWTYLLVSAVWVALSAIMLPEVESTFWHWVLRLGVLALMLLLVGPLDRRSDRSIQRILFRQTLKNARGMGGLIEYSFYDSAFTVHDSDGFTESGYQIFADLVETDRYYLLFIGKSMIHLLRKSDFTVGTAAEFGVFIQRVCGKSMRAMKIDAMKLMR